MSESAKPAEVNIHLRARTQDLSVLVEQSTIFADTWAFQKVVDWMDADATRAEVAGMKRLLQAASKDE